MKTIGLTGGIATGKSTVARFLMEMGAIVIDADQLAREAVTPGYPALQQLVELFGTGLLLPDGTLDRSKLRKHVFANPEKLKQLESIIHPCIKQLAINRLEMARQSGAPAAVYMAPLLIEAGATDRVDEIWVVTAMADVQLKRLIERDKCDIEHTKQIISAQMPLEEKEQYGVVVIDNSGDIESTRHQVQDAWNKRIAK